MVRQKDLFGAAEREPEQSKEEKNEVVLVGRFDSNQFVYKIPVVEIMCK